MASRVASTTLTGAVDSGTTESPNVPVVAETETHPTNPVAEITAVEPAGIVAVEESLPEPITLRALYTRNYMATKDGNPFAVGKGVDFTVYDPDLAKEYIDSGVAKKPE